MDNISIFVFLKSKIKLLITLLWEKFITLTTKEYTVNNYVFT